MKLLLLAFLATVGATSTFFHNEITGETQWHDPSLVHHDPDGIAYYSTTEGEAPSTWTQPEEAAWRIHYSDEHKQIYYYNEVSGDSQWEQPKELAWRKIEL